MLVYRDETCPKETCPKMTVYMVESTAWGADKCFSTKERATKFVQSVEKPNSIHYYEIYKVIVDESFEAAE